jgi:hypothetical protein
MSHNTASIRHINIYTSTIGQELDYDLDFILHQYNTYPPSNPSRRLALCILPMYPPQHPSHTAKMYISHSKQAMQNSTIRRHAKPSALNACHYKHYDIRLDSGASRACISRFQKHTHNNPILKQSNAKTEVYCDSPLPFYAFIDPDDSDPKSRPSKRAVVVRQRCVKRSDAAIAAAPPFSIFLRGVGEKTAVSLFSVCGGAS